MSYFGDIDKLNIGLKKFLKSDYMIYYDENSNNLNDIPKLSSGETQIKLNTKGIMKLVYLYDS